MSMGWVELLNWVALVAHIEVGGTFSYVWCEKLRENVRKIKYKIKIERKKKQKKKLKF